MPGSKYNFYSHPTNKEMEAWRINHPPKVTQLVTSGLGWDSELGSLDPKLVHSRPPTHSPSATYGSVQPLPLMAKRAQTEKGDTARFNVMIRARAQALESASPHWDSY